MEKIILNTAEHGEMLVELIRSGAYIPLCVTGTSMRPTLKPERDVVWLKACTPDDLTRGRILLFRRLDGSFILHRIRRRLSDGRLIMNGDAQAWCETISPERAVAVVEEMEIRGKRISYKSVPLRLWDFLWYPTRPLRPLIFRLRGAIKSRCPKRDA